MGDRGNIAVIHDAKREQQVWLYAHWSGSDLPQLLKDGIAASRKRWDDPSYANKIIFGHVISAADWKQEFGYGISGSMQDNSHPILAVDMPKKRVFTIEEDALDGDRRIPAGYEPAPTEAWTFEEYAALEKLP